MSIPVFVRDRFKEVSQGRNASLFGPPAIGKNVHNRSVDEGFLLTFNEALDPTRASNTGSDTVLTNSKHGKKTTTTPVAIISVENNAGINGGSTQWLSEPGLWRRRPARWAGWRITRCRRFLGPAASASWSRRSKRS